MKLVLPKHINMPSEDHHQVVIIPSSRLIKPDLTLGKSGYLDYFSTLIYRHCAYKWPHSLASLHAASTLGCGSE